MRASSVCTNVRVFAALAGVVFDRVSNPSVGHSCITVFSSLSCRLLAVFVSVRSWTRCKRGGASPASGDYVSVEILGLRVSLPISNPTKVNIFSVFVIFFLVVWVSLFYVFVIICVCFQCV